MAPSSEGSRYPDSPRNAYARPPEVMRSLCRRQQKCGLTDLQYDPNFIDPRGPAPDALGLVKSVTDFDPVDLEASFAEFLRETTHPLPVPSTKTLVYEVKALPGLLVIPSLLPPAVQKHMLNEILHRDLSNPQHNTNLHLHFDVPYEKGASTGSLADSSTSFFAMNQSTLFKAKDATVHKDLSMKQVLDKRLRWITLGGQYDWTEKQYPEEEPPAFPQDLKNLLRRLFPGFLPQAAIVNFYSPGDTLSVHRDVSEECDQGLLSISIGLEAIFLVGNEDGSATATLRLRSGDVVYMTGQSRFAWHAVPKVLPDTCPSWLSDWPATETCSKRYETWRHWMSTKRINLNVRQMKKDN